MNAAQEKEIAALFAKSPTVRPADVVEFARNPKTALHSAFTWDNSEAAHQWRLQQARMLLRVSVTQIGGQEKVRQFVSLVDDRNEDGGYRMTVAVLSDAEMRARLLRQALAELEVFEAKYASLKELAGVFKAVRMVSKNGRDKKRKALV